MSTASSAGLQDRLMRVRFRRAVTLMLMTLVLPGSAQLVVGKREVGRVALRVWLLLLLSVGVLFLAGMVRPTFVFWLMSNTVVLGLVRLVLLVLALGWAALFFDAWRLGEPLGLRQRQRLAMVGINGVLCVVVAGSLVFASHVVAVQRDFIATMFSGGVVTEAEHGRYNILLLGGDSGAGRWGLRPDSLTVASIDEVTGETVLFGLPRNMQNFPFPEGSVMAEQFPDGFDCDGCYLNGLSTWALDHDELFPGTKTPGVEATVQGVEGITGLSINYYAMVNLQGFRNFVDAVGGVELNVRDRIPIGGVGGPVTGYIEPGVQQLDGFQTLWFARSRETADDYSRMARQKCVMNAMLQQLSPQVVVTKFERIAKASTELISTDLPASELGRFMDLAVKARSKPLRTVSFVPPLVNTAAPDVEKIHARVQLAIDRSEGSGQDAGRTVEAGGKPGSAKARKPQASGAGGAPATTGGSIGSLAEGYAANDAEDLSAAC
jgi:LCP family protein required for cell wall assembly